MRFLEISIPHLSPDGNFRGAITALLHHNLWQDIDAVYLLPIFQPSLSTSRSPYCITDFKALNDQLGTFDDFDFFVESVHALNKKVVLDLVLNHTSRAHPWINRPDFYMYNLAGNPAAPRGTQWDDVAQLNHHNEAVRNELKEVVEFWKAKGVDGFRFDATAFIPFDFWKEIWPSLDSLITWSDTSQGDYLQLPFSHCTTHLLKGETVHDRSVVFTSNHDIMLSNGSIYQSYGAEAQNKIKEIQSSAPHYMAVPFEKTNDDYCYNFLLTAEPISRADQ